MLERLLAPFIWIWRTLWQGRWIVSSLIRRRQLRQHLNLGGRIPSNHTTYWETERDLDSEEEITTSEEDWNLRAQRFLDITARLRLEDEQLGGRALGSEASQLREAELACEEVHTAIANLEHLARLRLEEEASVSAPAPQEYNDASEGDWIQRARPARLR